MNRLLAEVNLGGTPLGGGRTLESTYPNAGKLINVIIQNSFVVIGLILLGILIYGGVLFIQSAGSDDSKKAAASKQIITDAVIGFAVVILAFFIIQIIQVITGLQILNSSL
jgi:hypothetical protein